jgi:DNA-binding NarL/FixJ family response regulator
VLLIGSIAKAEDLYELLLLGIQGFIPYSEVDGGLVRAVKTIGAGHLWANAEVLEQFALYASRLSQSRRPGPSTLTRREGVVVDLLQQRLSNKEIGAALNITERTVRFHLGNVFSKLGVHDRYSLAELAKSSKLFKSGGDTKDFRKPPD